jgi:hypothetical protein
MKDCIWSQGLCLGILALEAKLLAYANPILDQDRRLYHAVRKPQQSHRGGEERQRVRPHTGLRHCGVEKRDDSAVSLTVAGGLWRWQIKVTIALFGG